jgi:hypothetical protein
VHDFAHNLADAGKAYLGIGVDEGLLVDTSNTLQIADIERILGAAVTWMLALELAVCLLLGLRLFQRDDLRSSFFISNLPAAMADRVAR